MADFEDQGQAEHALTHWAELRDRAEAERDEIILAAVRAGVSKYRINKITGVARTTIDRIIKGGDS